jgi:hypothetical protein
MYLSRVSSDGVTTPVDVIWVFLHNIVDDGCHGQLPDRKQLGEKQQREIYQCALSSLYNNHDVGMVY